METANRRPRLWPTIGLALVALAVAFYIRHSFSVDRPSTRALDSSSSTPTPAQIYAAEFDDEDGKTVALGRWKGKLVLLNFWATWCVPCVKEMPDLQRAQDELGADRLTIVGIGAETPQSLRAFRVAHGLRFPLLGGSFEALGAARALGDRQAVLPYTALLSPEGRVLHTHVGALPPGQVRQWVEEFQRSSGTRS